jgi:putative ABC transport system permease protein
VVFQFTASILLIVGSIVIYRQLNYIQTKDIGFKKDQVLVVKDAYTLGDNTTAFKDEVLAMNGVISGTVSGYLPVSDANRNNRSFTKEPIIGISNGFNMENWIIDYDYIKTLGMELIKGRGFSREYPSDSNAVILNEAAVKLLGYEDPINKEIYASDDNKKTYSFKVIGIVKNFNYASLRQSIGPLGLFLGSNTRFESCKVRTADISHLLAQVEEKWKALAPATPFNYQFLDDSFNDMYRSEQKIGKIVLTFSVLAILIACLGLYGLATFMAEQRTKEIGIRKTLGATSRAIAGMLSMDFIKLVLVAFVLAIPIGWYFMQKWLQDFAYRIEMNWWWFGIAGATAIFIALLTVSFQSFKAALANPVKSLRSE